jgi:hypothetical protein
VRIAKTRRSRRDLYCAAVAGIAVAAAGLAFSIAPSSGGIASAGPALGAIPVVRNAAMISYPLDKYSLSDSQMTVIMKARRIFEIRCMQALGFKGNNFANLLTVGFNETAKSQFITFLDLAGARGSGYHSPEDRKPVVSASPKQSAADIAAENLQAAAIDGHTRAVNGHAVPAGGCRAEGLRDLEKGTSGILRTDPRYLAAESQYKAIADQRMRKVIAAWGSCMSAAGYSYQTPFDAVTATAGWRKPDGYFHTNPSTLERRTAMADATCRARVNLLGTWIAVESAYQEQIISRNSAALDHARTMVRIWLRNAEAAVIRGH